MSTDGYEEFVKVADIESDEILELPLEDDETLLITTLQGQFPNAVGLRYQSSSGSWRGVRISGDALNPPHGGWGSDTTYQVTLTKELKRKNEEPAEEALTKGLKRKNEDPTEEREEDSSPKSSRRDKKLLQDLIVLGLPKECKEADLKEYFSTACGELTLHQVKFDRETRKPKGFGFIRFKTEEGAQAALTGEHSIMGKTVEIKLSKKKIDPIKLFVGRLPPKTSVDELKEHFEEFGDIKDVYIPQPARGFGFVTFQHAVDGRAALKKAHKIDNVRLNVEYAEPLEEKIARLRREEEEKSMFENERRSHSSYGRDLNHRGSRSRERRDGGPDRMDSRDMRDDRRFSNFDNGNANHGNMALHESAAQLRGLLYSVLGGR